MGTDCEGAEVEGLVKASGHGKKMNPWLVIVLMFSALWDDDNG
jgi:hypothetical protein